ncbi:MAG: tetratricopeptide repeat protein [Gemmatimonadota bacterium]
MEPGSQRVLDELEARCAAVAERLKSVGSPEAKAAVKGEIIALFREVDGLHEKLSDMRERIRGLVEQYKGLARPPGTSRGRSVVYSDSLNSSTFVERGWNFIAAEKYDEAVEALEKALSLSPENLEAEGLLGWALMKSGRMDRAQGCVQRVLRAQPDNEMARVNLGYICFRRRIFGEAVEHLSRALELGQDRKATLYALLYLGLVHGERGNLEEAVGSLKRAIEVGPNLIEAYYHLGLLLHRHGKTDQARAVWESAVTRNAYNPYSKKARGLLEELEAGGPIGAV